MSKIGGGGIPPKPPGPLPADLKTNQGMQQLKEAAGTKVSNQVLDSFQKAGPAIQAKLQSLTGAQLMAKLKFTNEDLALLARTFAGTLRKFPNADRKKRSRLFAKAILKKKGALAQLLDEDDEEHSDRDRKTLEEMYDLIAEQLDSTPRFAQLVDDVTESARKIR